MSVRVPHPSSLASRAGLADHPGRPARAFTLIEMLIAVGAVTLIAIGLGKLFASTGDTVKIGRRVSNFNEVAATLERQLRADLAACTRDGYIVVRNKLAFDPNAAGNNPRKGIRLSAEDRNPSPRPRRVDELTFFAHGRFTSSREPLFPGRAPVSDAARIYYGHGMRAGDNLYGSASIDTDPALGAGRVTWPDALGDTTNPGNPNAYAGSWILLRHVTVLARPINTESQLPASGLPPYLSDINKWKDNPVQIRLQPAAASIFRFDPVDPTAAYADQMGFGFEARTVNPLNQTLTREAPYRQDPGVPIPTAVNLARNNDNFRWPSFLSGMVDVAAMDLTSIRARVLNMPYRLPSADSNAAFEAAMPLMSPVLPVPGYPTLANLATASNTTNPVHMMKLMMASGMPSNDPWLFNNNSAATATNSASGQHHEQRMLCADTPPDFTGRVLNSAAYPNGYPADEPYHQQDQAMLSASNMVVGCSEFIVEWSFGDVYPNDLANPPAGAGAPVPGTIIWHGLPRRNSNNTPYLAAPYIAATQYNNGPQWRRDCGKDEHLVRIVKKDGSVYQPPYALPSGLIHWPANLPLLGASPWNDPPQTDDPPLYSFFGYLDPTYAPEYFDAANYNAAPPNGPTAPLYPATKDWAWPRLFRFTVSLTDPADPNVEQTYQFVIEVPAADRAQ